MRCYDSIDKGIECHQVFKTILSKWVVLRGPGFKFQFGCSGILASRVFIYKTMLKPANTTHQLNTIMS